MASRKKSTKKGMRASGRSVTLPVAQFRSMILSKLRSDVEIRRAAFEAAKSMNIKDLGNMTYWQKGYWQKPYWKKGRDMMVADPVINPAPLALGGAVARKNRSK